MSAIFSVAITFFKVKENHHVVFFLFFLYLAVTLIISFGSSNLTGNQKSRVLLYDASHVVYRIFIWRELRWLMKSNGIRVLYRTKIKR